MSFDLEAYSTNWVPLQFYRYILHLVMWWHSLFLKRSMITPDFFVIIADVLLGTLGNFVVLCKSTTPTGGSLFVALLPAVRHRFLSVSFDFRCLTEEMAVLEFFGCAFIAFGPPLAMFAFTIAKDPIRIIILIARFVTAFLVFWFSCKHISATAIKSGELSNVILYAVRFFGCCRCCCPQFCGWLPQRSMATSLWGLCFLCCFRSSSDSSSTSCCAELRLVWRNWLIPIQKSSATKISWPMVTCWHW